MAKYKTKEAPYMVASYVRCEDVRKLRSQIRIDKCVMLLKEYALRENKETVENELRKEVDKILLLEKRVFELERRSFLSNRDILSTSMTIDVLKVIILEFLEKTLLFEMELDNYIKATI